MLMLAPRLAPGHAVLGVTVLSSRGPLVPQDPNPMMVLDSGGSCRPCGNLRDIRPSSHLVASGATQQRRVANRDFQRSGTTCSPKTGPCGMEMAEVA